MELEIAATHARVHLVSRVLGVESEEAQPQPVHVSQEGGAGEGGKMRNRENDCVTDGDRRSQKRSRKRR